MKGIAAFLLAGLFVADGRRPPPTLKDFAYTRAIEPGGDGEAGNTCVVLDAAVFAHAAPSLEDIRVFSGAGQEMPYAVTISETAGVADSARILNLGLKSPRHIGFDLQMPERPYSSVDLDLKAQDFIATARVTGLNTLNDQAGTYLGTYTVFDLTAQRLGHRSAFAFAESTFPYLHVELGLMPAPGNEALNATPAMVAGASIPASRVAQTVYTTIAETGTIFKKPRRSVASFAVPAHVPVERVTFELDPGYRANFDRPVTITARVSSKGSIPEEELSGRISRVRLMEGRQEVHAESLSLGAVLGINAQSAATVEVAVDQGDDVPVALKAVRLEMRQRKLCFAASDRARMVYGAVHVDAPVYDFGRLFDSAGRTGTSVLGAERENPAYRPEVVTRSWTERHPASIWVALVGVIAVLGAVAARSAKRL